MTVKQALAYAEDDLGIHKIYDETQELHRYLEGLYNTRAGLETESRKLVTDMERRKMEIINTALSAAPEESVAAHERRVRSDLSLDEAYQTMVDRSNEIMSHRDGVSATISGAENNMKAHIARMKLLGGFMEFCASVKQEEVLATMEKLQNPF